jgi:hypothetical protein
MHRSYWADMRRAQERVAKVASVRLVTRLGTVEFIDEGSGSRP